MAIESIVGLLTPRKYSIDVEMTTANSLLRQTMKIATSTRHCEGEGRHLERRAGRIAGEIPR